MCKGHDVCNVMSSRSAPKHSIHSVETTKLLFPTDTPHSHLYTFPWVFLISACYLDNQGAARISNTINRLCQLQYFVSWPPGSAVYRVLSPEHECHRGHTMQHELYQWQTGHQNLRPLWSQRSGRNLRPEGQVQRVGQTLKGRSKGSSLSKIMVLVSTRERAKFCYVSVNSKMFAKKVEKLFDASSVNPNSMESAATLYR